MIRPIQTVMLNNMAKVSENSWNPFHSLLHGDFATFQQLEDFYNVIMSIVCVLCAGMQIIMQSTLYDF